MLNPSTITRLLTLLIALAASACMQLQPDLDAPQPSVQSPQFKAKLESTALAKFTPGNQVETFINGRAYFPPMLADIASAKHTITFETFIFMKGKISTVFAKALAERAQAGVEVKVIVDWIGSLKIARSDVAIMRDGGVRFHYYGTIFRNPLKLNNRTHRKLMIVDGKVGWTGGAGFADAWNHNAEDKWHWRDTQYRITGPAVAELQHAFANNWRELTSEQISGRKYFPPLKKAGNTPVQVILGAPKEQIDTIGSSYLLAVNAAQQSIVIENPYVVLPKRLEQALITACQRGVKVTLLTPGAHTDMRLTRQAAHGFWPRLIKAGGKVYEYLPTMVHSKVMVIDDYLVIAGSANLDNRSFFINDEVNTLFLSKKIAQREVQHVQDDIKKATLLKPHQCKTNWFARFMRPQL